MKGRLLPELGLASAKARLADWIAATIARAANATIFIVAAAMVRPSIRGGASDIVPIVYEPLVNGIRENQWFGSFQPIIVGPRYTSDACAFYGLWNVIDCYHPAPMKGAMKQPEVRTECSASLLMQGY